jgi:hypothetical protein
MSSFGWVRPGGVRKGDPHHIYLHLGSGAEVAVHSVTTLGATLGGVATPDAPPCEDLWGANRGSWTPVGELGACVRRVGERGPHLIKEYIWR